MLTTSSTFSTLASASFEISPKASREVIKKAHQVLIKKYHPDLYSGEEKINAEQKTRDINEAYNILSNPNTKRRYDRTWYTHVGKKTKNTYEQPKNNKEAIFTMFFGN